MHLSISKPGMSRKDRRIWLFWMVRIGQVFGRLREHFFRLPRCFSQSRQSMHLRWNGRVVTIWSNTKCAYNNENLKMTFPMLTGKTEQHQEPNNSVKNQSTCRVEILRGETKCHGCFCHFGFSSAAGRLWRSGRRPHLSTKKGFRCNWSDLLVFVTWFSNL